MKPEPAKSYRLVPSAGASAFAETARCMDVFPERIIFVVIDFDSGVPQDPGFNIGLPGGLNVRVGVRILECRPEGYWREHAQCYYTIEPLPEGKEQHAHTK